MYLNFRDYDESLLSRPSDDSDDIVRAVEEVLEFIQIFIKLVHQVRLCRHNHFFKSFFTLTEATRDVVFRGFLGRMREHHLGFAEFN